MLQREEKDLTANSFQNLLNKMKKFSENENVLIGNSIEYLNDMKSISTLLLENGEKFKNRTAVISEEEKFSYEYFIEKVYAVRRKLIEKQVKKGDRIVLVVSNTVDTIVFMMAIISIGAAYVPIDKKYPESREKFIEEDCSCKFVFSKEDRIKIMNSSKFEEPQEKFNVGEEDKDNLEDSAYVIYTSGTTGQPKGVEIKQKYVLNLCAWFKETMNINENSRVLSLNSLCFDASVKNIFTTLLNGGSLVLNLESELTPKKLLDYIGKNKVNVLNGTPTMIDELLETSKTQGYDSFENLNVLITGGERFINNDNMNDLYLRKNKKLSIFNVYGPTECTSLTTYHEVKEEEILNEDKNIPIGIPLFNKLVYICDEDENILGKNQKGEIYIGGEGVAHKYINREALSKEKFITVNNFNVYKSGDIGWFDENRNLYCDGRIDSQIKLNGYRIELDEISKSIEKLSEVRKCTCIYENNMVIAFYTGLEKSQDEMKKKVKNIIPEYMVPNHMEYVQEFPQTFNGKLDKKKLKEDFKKKQSNRDESKEFLNDIQKKVADIWKKVLNIDTVLINKNFFDAGGNSLKLFKMARHIEKAFNVEIEPIELMELSSIKKISEFIEKGNENTTEESNSNFELIREKRNMRYTRMRRK